MPKKIGIVVFNQAFTDMGLVQDKTYTMAKNKLTRAARALTRCIELFGHNDFILGRMRELKLDNCVGRCIVMTGKIKNPDAQLTINAEKKSPTWNECTDQLEKHIDKLVASKNAYREDVEYM